MTFDQWLTTQYALHTSYAEGMQSGKQSDIKEYMKTAWDVAYEEGYHSAIDDGIKDCFAHLLIEKLMSE